MRFTYKIEFQLTSADTKDKPRDDTPGVAKSLFKTMRNLKAFLISGRKSSKDLAEEVIAEMRLEEEKRAEMRVTIEKFLEEKARKKVHLKYTKCEISTDLKK